ncbi:unnamed protein product [Rotaria sp. Silwood1]|nr:unnamed protein product [Rotaria sp. Silwood1]
MSYVFLENTHFIILDCEGLFSDQRTDDEEIKLISFLTAVCDITILSQDLGFSRFQDRLFAFLSQAVEKINKSEKLFKGILFVAIRDISDINDQESFVAAEKKFLDLQSKGKSGFVEQLFSNTFKVQLLHHFENKNFDYEIQELRKTFLSYVNTSSDSTCRWENGKTLLDRLKILLVQLYTDDFIDSDEIHCEMKLAGLIEQMKKAWTRFYLDDDEANIVSNEQIIEATFNNKKYVIKLNHEKLYLDENASDQNFDNICEFIFNELYPQNDSANVTKEEINKMRIFIDEIILEVMSYRRQQVTQWMIKKFKQEFPTENESIKERRRKFLNTIEQDTLSFKFNICLKKCSICDLQCIKNSQHTHETKVLLERKKEELKKVQISLETFDLESIRERMQKLNQDIYDATLKENNLRQEMNLLSNELKYLTEKENIETQINECDSKVAIEKRKIDDCQLNINDIDQELNILVPNQKDYQSTTQLLQHLDQEILSILNPNNYAQLNLVIDSFHTKYKEITNKLIHEHLSLSNILKSANEELVRLTTNKEQFNKQLYETNSINHPMNFVNSHECNEKYQQIVKDYENASLYNKHLRQELSDVGIYSRLTIDIEHLEREAQNKCSCETDHKCSGICQICAAEDKTKQNPCMFKAGHDGAHKCDSGHVCKKSCQICEIYGKSDNKCHFAYEHQEPEYHQCERIHQCPATCICSDPCTVPLELKPHSVHQCNKKDCWKPCIFSCGKSCANQDHKHDITAELVTIIDGRETHQVKKHLCNECHYCKGICDAPGVCKQEYKTQQRKWTTESGQEFMYDHIEVEEVRDKCGIKILAGKSSHSDIANHRCDGQHTCQERCPDCGSFCRNPHGHDGFHRTLHRNKEQHIFTSTNPNDQIEIRSNESEETIVRKYKVGESAKPENCSVSCKRRGRSHFHLVECLGGLTCWEKVLGNKAKHSDDTYYYEPDNPSTKKYDKILCSAYWSHHKWFPPVNDIDKKMIDTCNIYCTNHVLRDQNGFIVKDSSKAFCTLDAWHSGNHVFECQNDHHVLEMYQGINVCFVIDTTGSMEPYFGQVKTAINRIINDNQTLLAKIKSKCDFQFSVVDYRDHEPEGDYVYHKCDFTSHTVAMQYVLNLKSGSGGDFPEAVLDVDNEEEQVTIENEWLKSCYSNETEIKELLLNIKKDKLDINKMIDNTGTSLLHICALRGYDKLLSYMLNEFDNYFNINVNIIDKYGHTPLHWACMENNVECLNILIKHNNINLNMRNFDALFIIDHQTPIYLIGGQTCLHFACEYGHIECVSLLLQNMETKSIMIEDFNGYTPLDLAIMNSTRNDKCYEIVKLLNQFNMNENIDDKNTQILNRNDYFIQFCKDKLKVQKRTESKMKDTLPNMHGNCCHTCRKFYQISLDDTNEK